VNDRSVRRDQVIANCPTVDRREHRAYLAVLDAQDLVIAVRDLDPREVWGTLAAWGQEDPLRVYAVVTALAAMVPTDRPVRDMLAWTEQLTPEAHGAVRAVKPRDTTRDELLKAARAAYERGSREEWVVEGNRAYDRARKARHRARNRARNNTQRGAA